MKKYLYNIVLATLILFSTTAVNASNEVYYINKRNIQMTEQEYNNLLGMGFSDKQIANMDQEVFLENKDLQGTVLATSEKYYKTTTVMRNGNKYTTYEEITKEEAMREKELQTRGPAAGNYYDGIVGVTGVINQLTKIIGVDEDFMRYMTETTWLSMPSDRYNDIIGLGMESGKVQFGSVMIFRENWTDSAGVDHHISVCSPKYTSTGGLAIYELPTGSIQSLDATLYYNVEKQDNVGTITSLYAGGNFAHANSSVNSGVLLNYVSSTYATGVFVGSPYSIYYISNSAAIASFEGTW